MKEVGGGEVGGGVGEGRVLLHVLKSSVFKLRLF